MTDLFGPKGLFRKKLPGFECRPQQGQLAEAVEKALFTEKKTIIAAEAPPGVGKTYALLAPAMQWAAQEGTSIIFLTSSIPLQEQLINKDLPTLCDVLDFAPSFGLLKGRGNYACMRKVDELGEEGFFSFGDGGNASRTIIDWLNTTEDGDLSTIPLPPGHPAIERISASFSGCLGSACPYREKCFVQRGIKNASKWRVLVANYHLYFAYALGKSGSFPVPAQLVICDEAHRMAEAACSVSSVYARRDDWMRLLRKPPALDLDSSILSTIGYDREDHVREAKELLARGSGFFDLLQIRVPRNGLLIDPPEALVQEGKDLMNGVMNLGKSARKLKTYLAELGPDAEDLAQDGASFAIWSEEMEELAHSLEWCLDVSDYPQWSYWKDDSGLASSPSVCGDILPAAFDDDEISTVVAVSATMAVDGSFDYWSRETGLVPDEVLLLGSPFNLKEQMKLLVVDIGVSVTGVDYDDRICRVVRKLCKDNGGSSLVLLASTRLLRKVGNYLRHYKDGYSVYVQGDLPRTELLSRFRDEKESVLVGTVSFREGVDVPGDALTQVIIDRIPFTHPDDPIQKARKDLEGPASFIKSVLPNAKMQLRQAVGRLVRSTKDEGRVVILDSRILARRDWKVLESLPSVPVKKVRVVDRPVAPVDSV